MARESTISKEKVAAAVAELKEAGIARPSAGRVREHLLKKFGTGEPVGAQNRIQDFLNELRREAAESAQAEGPAYHVTPSLSAEISRAMAAVERQVREDLRAAHEVSVQELADMTTESRVQAILIEDLRAALAQRTTERDALTGELAAISQEMHAARTESARQQGMISELQLAVARAEGNLANASSQLEAKVKDMAHAGEVIEQTRAELDMLRDLHLEAYRRSAVAQVQLDAEERARQSTENQLTQVLAGLRNSDDAVSRAAAAEAALIELRSQVAVLQRLLERRHRHHGLPRAQQGQGRGDQAMHPRSDT